MKSESFHLNNDDDDNDGDENIYAFRINRATIQNPLGRLLRDGGGGWGDERVSKEYAGCRLRPVNT